MCVCVTHIPVVEHNSTVGVCHHNTCLSSRCVGADVCVCVCHTQANTSLTLRVDEVERDAVDSSGEPIDAKLYATFWSLQNVFKVCVCAWVRVRVTFAHLCRLRAYAGMFVLECEC